MQENLKKNNSANLVADLDLQELINALRNSKWIIISITTFISILGVTYSLLLPNIYESRALLAPVSAPESSSILQNNRGLAAIAGVNLTSSNNNQSVKALKKITTLSFFENNIFPYIFLPDLMAFKAWEQNSNKHTYDDSIYISTSNSWIQGTSFGGKHLKTPSPQQSFKVFINKHLIVNTDVDTGFVTISVKHQSPFIAKQWVELIVREVNAFYRLKDRSETERSINYLTQQLTKTSLSEIKQVIAAILKQETQKLTLIESNKYYVFEYIDPPSIMEHRSSPKRSSISIIGVFCGLILSLIIVIIKNFGISRSHPNDSDL